ncbi:MAG: DUF3127 domain-containing protein [Dysgonamonadaceae bacterium]|jgi:hypothetical protein|nr:DUF3127 domain-containing protein [Dysgonamonadaceae bacterium]
MQLSARLVQVLPLQTGIGRNGEWKKQDVIVETDGQYPKKICIAIWGDKIDSAPLEIGNYLNIDFDVESREFNGRWYTDVKAWKIEMAGTPSTTPDTPVAPGYAAPAPPPPLPANEADDLPF